MARLTVRLIIVCCGATATTRRGGFADPAEPLDESGAARAALRRRAGSTGNAIVAPSVAARQTAAAIGLEARVAPAIADVDWGDWSGLSFEEVYSTSPDALAAWLADPTDATPGGEGLAAVGARVGPWLDEVASGGGEAVAVTHAMIVRVILGATVGIPIGSAMRIDIAPLAVTELSFHRGWRLQEMRRS